MVSASPSSDSTSNAPSSSSPEKRNPFKESSLSPDSPTKPSPPPSSSSSSSSPRSSSKKPPAESEDVDLDIGQSDDPSHAESAEDDPLDESAEMSEGESKSPPSKSSKRHRSDGETDTLKNYFDEESDEEGKKKGKGKQSSSSSTPQDSKPSKSPDSDGEDDHNDGEGSPSKKRSRLRKLKSNEDDMNGEGSEDDDLDDFIVDDTNGAYKDSATDMLKVKKLGMQRRQITSYAYIQQPFQCGATPFSEKDKGFILSWSSVGIVTSHREQFRRAVAIKFYDSTKYKNVRFIDNYTFRIGALGENGAVFASVKEKNFLPNGKEDIQNPFRLSTVYCHPFIDWTASPDLKFTLPDGENAIAVGITSTFILIGTSLDRLRILSYTGSNQEHVWQMTGPIVTIVGWNHGDVAAIFHYEGTLLVVSVIDLLNRQELYKRMVALTPPLSTLQWAGFTPEGVLLTWDSEGAFRALSRELGQWVMMAVDTKELGVTSSKDKYWPFSYVDGKLMAIVCRGGASYPMDNKSVPVALPLRVDFLNRNNPSNPMPNLDEEYSRKSLFLSEARLMAKLQSSSCFNRFSMTEKAALDLIVKKQFQQALTHNQMLQALDLASSLLLSSSVEQVRDATKIAKSPMLLERIEMILKAQKSLESATKAIGIDEFIASGGFGKTQVGKRITKLNSFEGMEDEEEDDKGRRGRDSKGGGGSHMGSGSGSGSGSGRRIGGRWDEEDETPRPSASAPTSSSSAPKGPKDDDGETEMSFDKSAGLAPTAAASKSRAHGSRLKVTAEEWSDGEDDDDGRRRSGGKMEFKKKNSSAMLNGQTAQQPSQPTPQSTQPSTPNPFVKFIGATPAPSSSSTSKSSKPSIPNNPFAQ